MHAIADFLRHYPEFAIFLCIAAGYWIGSFKIRGFGLGTVVGTLIVALVVGQIGIDVPAFLKTVFFLLFMFATGYHVGPQFFSSLRKGVMQLVLMSVLFCVTGLGVVFLMATFFGFDKGFAAGLLSGSLTQSSVIGTAADAINGLSSLTPETRDRLAHHIPIADATTYLFGTIGAALLLAKIIPKLLRLDIPGECEKMARSLGAGSEQHAHPGFEVYTAIDLKAYHINPAHWAGRTVQELISALPPRVYLQRMRRGERAFYPRNNLVFRAGDIIAISGARELLVPLAPTIGEEVVDPDAMEVPFETVPVVINNRDIAGHTISEVVRANPKRAQGIHLRSIRRQGQFVPRLPNTRIERGDIFELVGRHDDLERVIPNLGVPARPTEKSDLIFIGLTCVVGILLGALTLRIGHVTLGLGTSGGVLIAGLVFGWFHSVCPQYGRIPEPAIWLMQTLGMNVFITVVGIAAAPHAIAAMKSSGIQLFIAGIFVTLIPHMVIALFGRYVLKMNAGILLGACAGAGTVVAGLQSVEDAAGSEVPVLGFTIPYALSNVILTAWGPVIVALISKT